MKKLLFYLTLVAGVLCTSQTADAYYFAVDNDDGVTIYYSYSGTNASVTYKSTSYNSYSGEVKIPETVTYNGTTYNVTSIDSNAFKNCSGLTEVTIPNTVNTICNKAFEGCSGLTEVTIGNSVINILEYAFSGCNNLTEVIIPNSVNYLGRYAFMNCSGLTEVTIGNSVTAIDEGAFFGCSSLTEVNIPSSVTSILGSAFSGCSDLKTVTLADGEDKLYFGASVFNNVSIETLYVGRSLEGNSYKKENPFSKTSIKTLTIGNAATYISDYAFSGCSDLSTVILADGEAELIFGGNVFKNVPIESLYVGRNFGCSSSELPFSGKTSIKTLTIGNSVTSIGVCAFYGCSGLTEVIIPNSVTSIGGSAFSYCSGLTEVIIPNSVTSIGDYVFGGCSGLTEITIPNSVTSIGDHAFDGCSGLTEVIIPNSVTSIGECAFSYCSGLTEVSIPNSVTSIGFKAFNECRGLKTVTLADGEDELRFDTQVFDYAPFETLYVGRSFRGPSSLTGPFYYNESIKTLIIGNSVTSIGENAFENCRSLTEVTIGNSVTSIDEGAFFNCSGLTEVTIPNSVTSIGRYAFDGCSGLTEVTIGNSVTSIGDCAFYRCSGLTEVIIPNSVTSIGGSAFSYCSGLTEVIISNSVTSIGGYAFENCYSLKKVAKPATISCYFDSSVNIIDYDPTDCKFEHGTIFDADKTKLLYVSISKTSTFTIPATVTEIGDYAFACCNNITEIESLPEVAPENSRDSFGDLYNAVSLNIPAGAAESYLNTGFWYLFNEITAGDMVCGFELSSGLNYRMVSDSDVVVVGAEDIYLTEISVPARVKLGDSRYNVTAIGKDAFADMINLKSIKFGSNIKYIYKGAFDGCCVLEALDLPQNLAWIDDYAFNGCMTLKSVEFPDNLSVIGASAFENCTALASVTFGSGLASIGDRAFLGCTAIASLDFHDNLTSIGASAFSGCKIQTVEFPDNLSVIGASAFENCTNLASVTFGNGLTSIGDKAFLGCTAIASLDFHDNLTSIGASAFSGCKIQTIEFPDNLSVIGASAFQGCISLASVTFGTSRIALGKSAFSNTPITSVDIIANNIGEGCFQYCKSLTSAKLDCKEIGAWAFDGCPKLSSIDLLSVKTIGAYAFERTALTEVVIPASVNSIGKYAFSDCPSLKKFTIAETASSIELEPESNIIKGSPVTDLYIGRDCSNWDGFYYNWDGFSNNRTSLTKLTIGNNVNEMSESAFNGFVFLQTLILGSSLTTIPALAFEDCISLTDIVIPANITSIGDNAFNGCTKVDKIALGCGITEIGQQAFYNNTAAQSVCVAAVDVPQAYDNSFSLYDVPLYVPEESIDDYDVKPWSGFIDFDDPHELILIDRLTITGDTDITNAEAGQTYRLEASFSPSNATLPYIFWRSTNPKVATVDVNGVVTILDTDGHAMTAKIIAETMYANGPVAEVTVSVAGAPDPTEITFVDGVEYTGTKSYTGVDVIYKRNFTSTNWQALYLPYNMAYDDWADKATVSELTDVKKVNDQLILVWTPVTSGELVAGHPYIIQPNESGQVEFLSENRELKAADYKDDCVITVDGTTITVSGTYTEKSDMATTGAYALSGGEFRPTNSDAKTLKPFRIFLTIKGSAPMKIINYVDVEGSGIEGIVNDVNDNEGCYDLLGHKITRPGRGIYIINGKKTLNR